MKRFPRTLGAAMIIAATGAAIMVGCKKEESAQMKDGVAQTEQNMSPEEQKVLDFLADYDAMKQGIKADGEAVTPEQLLYLCETSVNYCYGFTQDHLTDVRMDTIHVAMPKTDALGNIAYNDQLATYGEIISAIRETYKSINMENKTLKFVVMSLNNKAKDGDNDITIVMNTGRNTDGIDPQGPFNVDECYLWGIMGNLESTNTAVRQEYLKVLDYDYQMMYYYTPCPTCTTWIDNISDTTYYGYLENNDSLFYATGLTLEEVLNYQLCYDDLNREYFFIVKRGHWGQPTNLYNVDWYYYTNVFSNGAPIGHDLFSIWHYFTVFRCTRHWRHGDAPYPIPIDEEQER